MIKKLLIAASLFLLLCKAEAATYYVRTDGGTASQCTGSVDAPYPGTGTGQACAWSHLYVALPPGGTPLFSGGDTVIVKRGSYMHGLGAPNTPASSVGCNTAAGWNCNMAAIPPGPSPASPTRILGEGWDKGCMKPPELWGTNRVNMVVNMQGSSNTELRCFEITDHSQCGFAHPKLAARCSTTYPYGTWGNNGLYLSDAAGAILRDLNIHGMAGGGVASGRNSNLLVERVRLAANLWVGWSGDIDPKNSSNSGSLVFRNMLIEWNGCLDKWPKVNEYHSCSSIYGDGVGFAETVGDFVWEDSTFRYNTSDGLDLIYVRSPGTVTLRRLRAEGNAGNQLKMTGLHLKMTDSIVNAQCDFFNDKPFTFSVDPCRALGDALVVGAYAGGTAEVVNNTVIGKGNTSLLSASSSSSTFLLRNNIFIGRPSYFFPDRPMAGYYTETNPVATRDHNIWWNIHGANCAEGVGSMCVDPKLVSDKLLNPDWRLRPGSPAINAGLATGASSTDYTRGPRSARGGVDIGAIEAR